MNRRNPGDEFAAAVRERSQRFAQGDRVRIRNTGELGTVLFMHDTCDGRFVMVRLDGQDNRNHRYTASKLERVEALF